MKNRLLTYGNHFCAVEHAIEQNFHLLQLKKKKKELTLSKQESYTNFNDLIASLHHQKHLFLILNNEQVLSKEVNFVHSSKERVVKLAFPNIGLQDFYVEVYDNEASSMVAICRKEVVDTFIEEYSKKGISVIGFSLGNLKAHTLLSFLEIPQIRTSNAILNIENDKIIRFQKEKTSLEEYNINGLKVDSNHLLSLAGIIFYYSGIIKDEFENEFQNSLFKEYQQKRFFFLGLRVALGFLFVTLLFNFLVFTNYKKKVDVLTSELTLNSAYKKQLISLKEAVSKKKKLVESIHSASNSKVIWYIDEISKTVPTSLLLNEVSYQPLAKPIREEKQVVFRNGKIVVRGISKDNIDFTRWIAQLENLTWIDKISALNYGNKKTKQTSFDFVIEMNTQNR